MRREDLRELHYITPIANVPSIMVHGILCHSRAAKLRHLSVADPEVQSRRKEKRVPGGRRLHGYANLYICARNPMLYRRHADHATLCVLCISPDVLDIEGTVVTDQNAASDHVRFTPAPRGLAFIDGERVFAEYWTHADTIEEWRHKSAMCAEVLVPDCVPPNCIVGAYVSCEKAAATLREYGFEHPVHVDPHMFFQPRG